MVLIEPAKHVLGGARVERSVATAKDVDEGHRGYRFREAGRNSSSEPSRAAFTRVTLAHRFPEGARAPRIAGLTRPSAAEGVRPEPRP